MFCVSCPCLECALIYIYMCACMFACMCLDDKPHTHTYARARAHTHTHNEQKHLPARAYTFYIATERHGHTSQVHNSSVAMLVPATNDMIRQSLSLLNVEPSRLRLLTHSTYYTAQDVWLLPPGVCGIGPASLVLRRMSGWLRRGLLRDAGVGGMGKVGHDELSCVLVRRKAGGGREIENHDELESALNLMPSFCKGRWRTVTLATDVNSP